MKGAAAPTAIVGVYAAIFLAINLTHFAFFPVHVVLYDTLADLLIAGVVFFWLYNLWLKSLLRLPGREAALSMLVGGLIGALYAVLGPTAIDRSLSIYILEKLAQRGGAIPQSAFEEILKEEFFREHHLVDARLTEQLNSGTIMIENGCVRLLRRGEMIAAFTRFYRTTFLPKHRELMGTFTDELTDPFRKSETTIHHHCGQNRPSGSAPKLEPK